MILTLSALLCSCQGTFTAHNERRAAQLKHDNALYYRTQCIEALERARAVSARQELPAALSGQSCQSPALGDYALRADLAGTVKTSVITLDPGRLSDYTLVVTGLNGQTYDYVDRGDAEAQAEQAGTFEATPPDVVTPAESGEASEPTVDETSP
ncbi:hypothetical protein C8263_13110 [Deinococcus arcticus]|uniref:Pilin A4 domain-containing protein n=2 Tax=Deinococcus arcticus TaxID=2136176 RepID=A0A2T3W5U1_9DEIO|nr:hypothetical protein C8263_13110 [Deinococcus arcticus]